MHPRQPQAREQQRHHSEQRQEQRHPQPLHVRRADRGETAAAEMVRDDGVQRAGRAHQRDEDR
jgi:hypothetical protein